MAALMIVDDSEADQFLSQNIIEEYDPEITILQAFDGQEALEILIDLEKQPDAIFLDINMPRMSGHDFLEEYTKWENQTTIIVMLTSSDQEADKERSQSYNCVKEFFEKPLNDSHLDILKQLNK